MRDQKQLGEIAKEVAYEWKMLRWTYETLVRRIGRIAYNDEGQPSNAVYCTYGTSINYCEGSAMLEPFLLHARNLRDFLYKDSGMKDDVLAIDFFVNPDDWKGKRPQIGRYLEGLQDRLNKALAHISYARTNYEKNKEWDVAQIKDDLDVPWTAFLTALPTEIQQSFSAPY